jgi:NADPH-dependent 2,4-dienoyl-CoA reductase/sulfur reductase-like enzyme
MEVLIIGGGPGGIQASRTLKLNNPEINVTIIRPEPYSVIYCALPYVVEQLVDKEKIRKSDTIVTDLGVNLVKQSAVNVDFTKKEVITDNNEKYNYDKLIIATGANPFIPPIKGSNLPNVVCVKTEKDLEKILGYVEKGSKKAVVVGAGNIGIEMSVALQDRGVETYLVEMQNRVLPNMLSEEFSKYPEEDIKESGVTLMLNTKVEELKGEEFVTEVVLSGNNNIQLEKEDLIIFAVGVKANTKLFENTDLEIIPDGIKVNSKMQTNIENVYAVGDVASFVSFIDGKPIGGKLATNAVPMGKIAAYNILGKENIEYQGFINGAITKSVKWRMGSTGFIEEVAKKRGFDVISATAETTTKFPIIPGAKKIFLRLVAEAKTGQILGAEVVGGEGVPGRIDVISLAIQNRNTVHDLFKFSYSAQPFQSFFPASNVIVQAAEKLMNQLEK